MILISTEIKIEYRILFHPMDLFSNNCSFHLYWINLSSLNYKICKIRSNVRFAIRVCIYHQKKKKKKKEISINNETKWWRRGKRKRSEETLNRMIKVSLHDLQELLNFVTIFISKFLLQIPLYIVEKQILLRKWKKERREKKEEISWIKSITHFRVIKFHFSSVKKYPWMDERRKDRWRKEEEKK